MDLADAVNWNSAIVQLVEQHALRRRHGVVMAVCSPHIGAWKFRRRAARSRDPLHACPAVFRARFANAVEFVDRDDVFMRGDLKDAVG